MRIRECELRRLRVPFRAAFKHAAATRATGDAIIVNVTTESGVQGFGEIQARPYVTGEDNDSIWNARAPAIARALIGQHFSEPEAVRRYTSEIVETRAAPALAGGFDIALLDAMEIEHADPWPDLLGRERTSKPGKCLTIGEDIEGDSLKNQARLARIGSYSVVKLKVSRVADLERISSLRAWLGEKIALRLDANGMLDPPSAAKLLEGCRNLDVESLEEPLPKTHPELASELMALYKASGIPFVADESICTVRDLETWAESGGYQYVNIRVGKSGGISGTVAFLKTALELGFGVVSGTMVGETAVMLRASRQLLNRCEDLAYIEGINQSRQLLKAEPIIETEDQGDTHFQWVPAVAQEFGVGRKTAK